MNCECYCEDFDRPSVVSTTIRKARKPHKCCECDKEIHKGQRYQFISGLWDGEWDSYKTCLPCASIRNQYCPHGAIFGNLVVVVFECLEFDYREVPE